jgi:GntR family transcriptional regulator/MocR family aminotransferase
MRGLYAKRRAALADALTKHVPSLAVELQPGGMHLLARLPSEVDDIEVAARLTGDDIAVTPLSTCGVHSPFRPGMLIGFANVETHKAPAAARRLARAMDGRAIPSGETGSGL